MLVLTRRKDEAIHIGEDIEITVLDIDGEQIKLGIQAPKHVEIHRKEIYVAIQQANNKATEASKDVLSQLNKQMKQNL
ncbi:carbon storage regulator CsrA [Cytobacillus sp. IB215665]|uniref:carbon storage regulator CsrA n=1 Tax=Cytobacillus sp. IB215665 TaxID=3097357 RepID=UPI002A11A9FC|nr:carbon storage regulator CsrA [Cytobacillus sp. IB215665]MDX8363824.1 carbon storage regulator CsrA [Cytobacillus sp. IB215665]